MQPLQRQRFTTLSGRILGNNENEVTQILFALPNFLMGAKAVDCGSGGSPSEKQREGEGMRLNLLRSASRGGILGPLGDLLCSSRVRSGRILPSHDLGGRVCRLSASSREGDEEPGW